jgi:hypothetical protein
MTSSLIGARCRDEERAEIEARCAERGVVLSDAVRKGTRLYLGLNPETAPYKPGRPPQKEQA